MPGRLIPHRTPFFVPLIYPSLIWRIPAEGKEVYLTFDDGPIPGPTEFVLDTLQQTSAKATFFCIGDNIKKFPKIFAKLVEAGHTVGNHTNNHVNGWKTGTEDYIKNIKLFDQQLAGSNASPTKLFRPPYGRITPSQIRALKEYRIFMWDVLSFDYSRSLSPDDCLRSTLKAVRPGSIIVFHDSLKAEKNMTFALPRFIDALKEKGYSFRSLS